MKIQLPFTLALATFTFGSYLNAQTPKWIMVNDVTVAAGGMVSDASGNIYIANDFGAEFLTKTDNTGNVLWKKPAKGAQLKPPAVQTYPNSIALDPSGNILVSGFFTSDSIVFGSVNTKRVSTVDMFVAKFDINGDIIWARTVAVGNVGNVGFKVTSDASGNVLVAGSYSAPTLTVGTTSFTNPCTSGGGCPSMLVIKYDNLGNVVWAKSSFANIGTSYAYSVATDAAQNVYVGGDFLGRNAIVKYKPNGDTLWTQKNGGWYVTVDPSGNLYSGYDRTLLDGVVKKYDPNNGAILWASTATGNTKNFGFQMFTDVSGNIYYAGTFRSSSIAFGTVTLNHNGPGADDDIFIVKYNKSGTVLWAKAYGGTSFDVLSGVTADPAGNIFAGGYFLSTVVEFDTIAISNTGQISGVANIYFGKLGNTPLPVGIDKGTSAQINTLHMYPNPVKDQLILEIPDYQNRTLEIINSEGHMILSCGLSSSKTFVKTDFLPAGVYQVLLKGPEAVSVKKFIKN